MIALRIASEILSLGLTVIAILSWAAGFQIG